MKWWLLAALMAAGLFGATWWGGHAWADSSTAEPPVVDRADASSILARPSLQRPAPNPLPKGGPLVERALKLASTTYKVPVWKLRRVAWCESRLNTQARNPFSTATGLFQHLKETWARNPYGKRGFKRTDPYASSLAAARWVAQTGNWKPWLASKSCHGFA